MDNAGNEGERDRENRQRQKKTLKHCPNCGGEVEYGSLYSPGRGNSRVYFSYEDEPTDKSSHLPVLAAVCRECGQIALMTDQFGNKA